MERTDLELIQAFRNGDRSAADELVERHLSRVRNLLFQMVLDHHIADDLTQDVFASAWRHLDSFRGQASFTTWLHRISLNAAYAYLRRSDRRQTFAIPDESIDGTTTGPHVALLQSERAIEITTALGRLNPQLRAAIVLTTMQGLPAAAVAEIEECSVGTIYWRLHEARRRLREELKDWIE